MKVTKARCKISWHPRVRQHRLPASYYRGGTSRAIIFSAQDLPLPTAPTISHPLWASIFRSCLGSPDPNGRQLDGLGGGISSLSKVCVIGPAKGINKRCADVEYTFAAVGVKDDEVDYSSNCGNMTAAVGPWAWDHGFIVERQEERRGRRGDGEDGTEAVRNLNRIMSNFFNTNIGEGFTVQRQQKAWEGYPGQDGMKVVRILNTNTRKIIRSTFEVRHGEAMVDGDMEIAGVAGKGAPIQLDFLDPAGSKTGKLLPTGNVVDTIEGVTVSCVDAGNPCVFVCAEDVDANGAILPEEFDGNMSLRERLDKIRRLAGVKMGLARTTTEVPGSIPKICMVSKPKTHHLLSGVELKMEEFDLMARAVSVGQPHRAVPITVALCLAVAAKTRGTVVEECLSDSNANEKCITIGHPSGKIVVSAKFNEQGEVQHATLFRTARRLFEGTVFWKVPEDDIYSEYGRNKSGEP